MKKDLLIIVFLLLSFPLAAQKIPLKEILKDGQQYYAILDTTGLNDQNELKNISAELKKHKGIREILLICGKDSGNSLLKGRLGGQNIILAGLYLKNNTLWNALSGGVYEITKQRAGSLPPGIGLKAIGDNPFGEGMSVVFTSNSPAGLKNILSFEKSEKSFYALMGDQVVESLNLNRKFSLDETENKEADRIPLDKALEDINYYFNTVQSVHPQLLKHLPADEYLKMKKSIADTLAFLDKNKDLTAADLSILLSAACARFKDGHTYVSPSIKSLAPVKMPPFRFDFSNGKLLIASLAKGLPDYSGYEILKIEKKDPAEFLSPALSLLSAETENYRMLRFTGNQGKYLAVKNVFNMESFSVTLKNSKGEISEVKFSPVTYQDFQNIPQNVEKVSDSYFGFMNNGAAAYFRYNQFVVSDKEKALIDSLFKMIDLKKCKDLIIDLRYNGGGNSTMGDYILSYVTSKPYCMVSRMEVRISKELLKRGGYGDYKELEGMTIAYEGGMTTPEKREHKFNGRLILLTSLDTFSSACLLTEVVKDFKLGTIIGHETGGMRQAFGDIVSFSTPNFSIPFGVSHKIFYAPVPQPGDELHGTMPDIEATDELLKDYADSKDPILDFTLNYIAKQPL